MQVHIWCWFMVFVLVVFVLLWVFQILFLQNFYDRMKTSDIIQIANTMVEQYQSGDYKKSFSELALENDMCIEVRDRYGRSVYS